VFVRYSPRHIFQNEWVYNDADIDRSRIVWARDLGFGEDQILLHYYPDRTAWLLDADATPPKLTPYQAEEPPKAAPPTPQPAKAPALHFEQVN
jgi:hypothetical protein